MGVKLRTHRQVLRCQQTQPRQTQPRQIQLTLHQHRPRNLGREPLLLKPYLPQHYALTIQELVLVMA